MRCNFYRVVIALTALTPVFAAFKDFVIEKESDLQRFDGSNENLLTLHEAQMYDEQFDDDWDALGGQCVEYAGVNSNYEYEIEANDLAGYNIDEQLLNEIMQHLANGADFPNYLDQGGISEANDVNDFENGNDDGIS